MRPLRSLLWLTALAVGVSACSLALDFGPEGQPCDAQNKCLTGYVCQAGYCVSPESASTDGGLQSADAGVRRNGEPGEEPRPEAH
jgi:hypothetical protein